MEQPTAIDLIAGVTLVEADPLSRERGLLGFLRFGFADLVIDGVALRHTLGGRPTLAFPERRDRFGRRHPIVRPRDDQARLGIERALFRALCIPMGSGEGTA